MADVILFVVTLLAFGAVTAVVFVVGQYYETGVQVERRLPVAAASRSDIGGAPLHGLPHRVARYVQATRFGLSGVVRERLRRDLIRAGYFGADAVENYLFWRLTCLVALPTAVYLGTRFFPADTPWLVAVAMVLLSILVAAAGPDAYLARRRRLLVRQYRLIFPDFLDLLVVCIDAGLTLDAAFDRVRDEIAKRSPELGMNLEMMSDEMRDRRLLRAEEAANKLTVKMVLPLGLFIFPVVLLVALLPVIIKLLMV